MSPKSGHLLPAIVGCLGAIAAALIGAFALIYINVSKTTNSDRNDNAPIVNANINEILREINTNRVSENNLRSPLPTPTANPREKPTPEPQGSTMKRTLNGVDYELIETRFE